MSATDSPIRSTKGHPKSPPEIQAGPGAFLTSRPCTYGMPAAAKRPAARTTVLQQISSVHALPKPDSAFLSVTRSTERQPYSWRILRNKNFRLYFYGSVGSDFGTWMQNTAQVLLAYRMAHSALAVGLVTCAQFSSPLVLGPWAGVLADRFGGRRTLLCTQVVSAVISALLAAAEFGHVLNEWWLVSGALASGLTFTFALPAPNVTVRRLVPEEQTRPAYVM